MPPEVNKPVIMEGMRIIFRNFAGREGPFNREGDRSFSILLDSEVAEAMLADGWNVKHLKVREEGDEPQAHLPVAIKFPRPGTRIQPPTIVLITSRGRTALDEESCELLDWVDIANVDLIVRPYEWVVSGKTGIKAYLKAIYVTVNEDALMLKYQDVPEVGSSREQLALEGGQQYADNVWEGEVLDVRELPARAGRVDDDDPPWQE